MHGLVLQAYMRPPMHMALSIFSVQKLRPMPCLLISSTGKLDLQLVAMVYRDSNLNGDYLYTLGDSF
jgi:hypothetical protein